MSAAIGSLQLPVAVRTGGFQSSLELLLASSLLLRQPVSDCVGKIQNGQTTVGMEPHAKVTLGFTHYLDFLRGLSEDDLT